MRFPVPNRRLAAALVALTLAMAACGDDASEDTATDGGDDGAEASADDTAGSDEDASGDAAPEGEEVADGVTVSGAWARTSPMGAEAGAAYLTISADEAISIVSASVPAEVAGTVELHETVLADDEGSMEEDAMEEGAMEEGAAEEMAMTMVEVESIDVPAGGSVELKPGGLHVMLLDIPTPLELGQTFDLTLVTADGVEIVVPVEVMDAAP